MSSKNFHRKSIQLAIFLERIGNWFMRIFLNWCAIYPKCTLEKYCILSKPGDLKINTLKEYFILFFHMMHKIIQLYLENVKDYVCMYRHM